MTRLALILIALASAQMARGPMPSMFDMWKYRALCCRPERYADWWHWTVLIGIRNMGGPGVEVPVGVEDYFDADGDGDVDLRDIVEHIARASETVSFRAAKICRACPERCDGVPGFTCEGG